MADPFLGQKELKIERTESGTFSGLYILLLLRERERALSFDPKGKLFEIQSQSLIVNGRYYIKRSSFYNKLEMRKTNWR